MAVSDWQVGDLAVCVDDTDYDGSRLGVELGRTYRVTDIFLGYDSSENAELALELAGVHPSAEAEGIDANCFRKIRPDEHEACEEEFVTLLNRTKRGVTA